MLDLTLDQGDGRVVWLSSTAPAVIKEMKRPPILIRPGQFTASVRDITLQDGLGHLRVQSMAHHARSCYLGYTEDGFHYFAKGIGWCLSPGWHPDRGNTGVLAGWAARRERDIALGLSLEHIRVAEPVAIYSYDWLPGLASSSRWPSAEVRDLDGSAAEPSLYIYRSRERFRMADLPVAARELIPTVRDRFPAILSSLRDSVTKLHSLGGHDYSLSLHNVWADGSRVDFEYVVLGDKPHPVEQLNQNLASWQAKEWAALRCLAFEIADMVSLEADVSYVESLCSPAS